MKMSSEENADANQPQQVGTTTMDGGQNKEEMIWLRYSITLSEVEKSIEVVLKFLGLEGDDDQALEDWVEAVKSLTQVVYIVIEIIKNEEEPDDGNVELFLNEAIPKVSRKLFLKTIILPQYEAIVNKFFQAVLSVSLLVLDRDLDELLCTTMMLLNGPIFPPGSSSLSNDSDVEIQKPLSVIQVATLVSSVPGSRTFYEGHGKPLHMEIDRQRVSFWPKESFAVKYRLRTRIGQIVELIPLKGREGPTIVKLLHYDLGSNTFHAVVMKRQMKMPVTEQEKNQNERDDHEEEEPMEVEASKKNLKVEEESLPCFEFEEEMRRVSVDLNQYQVNVLNPAPDGTRGLTTSLEDIGRRVEVLDGHECQHETGTIIDWLEDHQCYVVKMDDCEFNDPPITLKPVEVRGFSAKQAEKKLGDFLGKYQEQVEKEAAERFVAVPEATVQPPPSLFAVDNVDLFGRREGFAKITERTRNQKKPVPLPILMLYIRLFLSVQTLMSHTSLTTWRNMAAEFHNVVQGRFETFGDKELREIQQHPKVLWHLTNNWARLAPPKSTGPTGRFSQQVLSERMILQTMIEYLRLHSIESRLFGVQNILDAIRVHSNLPPGASPMLGGTQRATTKTVPVYSFANVGHDWLRSFLQAIDIVGVLYASKNLHFELLRRSSTVVLFMGREKLIKDAHLQTIWQASIGRDYASMRIIHNLLISLMPRITHAQRIKFFKGCVSALAFEEYDEGGETLRFISQLTVAALEADEKDPSISSGGSPSRCDNGEWDDDNDVVEDPTNEDELKEETMEDGHNAQGHENVMDGEETNGVIVEEEPASVLERLEEVEQDDDGHDDENRHVDGNDRLFEGDDERWYGLKLLWTYILDDDPSAVVLSPQRSNCKTLSQRKEAITLLVQLLMDKGCCVSQRNSFVDACMENIGKGQSVPQSLDVLKRIIISIPHTKTSWFLLSSENRRSTKELMIERLDKQHKLLTMLVDDFTRYQERMRPVYEMIHSNPGSSFGSTVSSGTAMTSTSVPEILSTKAKMEAHKNRLMDQYKLIGSCYTHLDQLTARFDFLLFISTNSLVCLKKTVAKQLWEAMVVHAYSQRSRDIALSWFGKAQASGGGGVLSGLEQDASNGQDESSGKSPRSPKSPRSAAANNPIAGNNNANNSGNNNNNSAGQSHGNGANGSSGTGMTRSSLSRKSVLCDDVPQALFKDEMQRLNISSLSPMALRVYQSYFFSINYQNKAIRRSAEHPGTYRDGSTTANSPFLAGRRRARRNREARALARVLVGGGEAGADGLFEYVERNAVHIEGMDFIWRTALEAERNDVGFSAIAQLVHLYVRLSVRLKAKKNRLQYDFIHRCVEEIVQREVDAHSASSPSFEEEMLLLDPEMREVLVREREVRRIRRASTLLKLFLGHFSKSKLQKSITLVVIPPAIGFPGSLTRRDWISMGTGTSFTLHVDDNTTLREVLRLIAEQIVANPNSIEVRLVTNPCRSDPDADIDQWFRSSDYLSFSKKSRSMGPASSNMDPSPLSVIVPKPAFTEQDLDKTLTLLNIQDWDILKVLDVKLDTNKQQQQQQQQTTTKQQKDQLLEMERQIQMEQIANPIIEKTLAKEYGDCVPPFFNENELPENSSMWKNVDEESTSLKFETELGQVYDLLFAMLDDGVDPSVQDQIATKLIWDSLLLLPKDVRVLKMIGSLEKPWDTILPVKSTYRLLYTLRLMCTDFLHIKGWASDAFWNKTLPGRAPSPSSPSPHPPQTNDWSTRFVQAGGLDRLLYILFNHNLQVGAHKTRCLTFVMKTICEILFDDPMFASRVVEFLRCDTDESEPSSSGKYEGEEEHDEEDLEVDETEQQRILKTHSTSSQGAGSGSNGSAIQQQQHHHHHHQHQQQQPIETTASPPKVNASALSPKEDEHNAFRRFSTMIKNRARSLGIKRGSDQSGTTKMENPASKYFEDLIHAEGTRIIRSVFEALLESFSSGSADHVACRQEFLDQCMLLIFSCFCVGDKDIFDAFTKFQEIRTWTEQVVLFCDDEKLRRRICKAILVLCSHVSKHHQGNRFALDYLKQLLPVVKAFHAPVQSFEYRYSVLARRAHRNLSSVCSEFYILLCGLIAKVDPELDESFFQDLFDHAVETLIRHDSLESFHSIRQDNLMIGQMRLLRALIRQKPEFKSRVTRSGLIQILYHDFLYAPIMENYYSSSSAQQASSEEKTETEAKQLQQTTTTNTTARPPTRAKGLLRRSLSGQSLILHDRSARCKTEASRDMAFALLTELCTDDLNNILTLLRLLSEEGVGGSDRPAFLQQFHNEWNYNPLTLLKHPSQYTGLKNQGATCYMNAFLQQLYHIPSFAEGILGINAGLSETLIHQLQVTFGSLRVSTRHYYNTLPLCQAVSEVDGRPLNLSEQKDANEFATQMFDRIESESTEAKEIIRTHFGGTLVNQIISKDVENPYVSERDEPFHILPLDIKGHTNLGDALESMVQSEMLMGENQYRLDSGETVDAIKRTCIKKLPNHLIINLKRFEFDLQTLTKHKLNDRFEFPLTINLEPYTYDFLMKNMDKANSVSNGTISPKTSDKIRNHRQKLKLRMNRKQQQDPDNNGEEDEDVDDDERDDDDDDEEEEEEESEGMRDEEENSAKYEYQLVGIIAHTGTMDSGHYFSFVRERKPRFPRVGGQWMEFNDKLVWPYPIDCIPADCFGGFDSVNRGDGSTVEIPKQRSAYMLIYDRKLPDLEDGSPDADEAKSEEQDVEGMLESSTFNDLDESLILDDNEVGGNDSEDEEAVVVEEDMIDIMEQQSERNRGKRSSSRFSRTTDPELSVIDEHISDLEEQDHEEVIWHQFEKTLTKSVDKQGRSLWHYFVFKRRLGGKPNLNDSNNLQQQTQSKSEKRLMATMMHLPSHVVDAILKDNLTFIKYNYIFAWSSYKFVWNLQHIAKEFLENNMAQRDALAAIDQANSNNLYDQMVQKKWTALAATIKLSIRFLIHVSSHGWTPFVNGIFVPWQNQLLSLISATPDVCLWLLEQFHNAGWTSIIFHSCPKPRLRHAMVSILVCCIRILNESEIHDTGMSHEIISNFIDHFISSVGSVTHSIDACPPYFELLYAYASLGKREQAHLRQHHLLAGLVKMYVQYASNLKSQDTLQQRSRNLSVVAGLINLLIHACYPEPTNEESEVIAEIVQTGIFWEKLMENGSKTVVLDLVRHLGTGSEQFGLTFLALCNTNICKRSGTTSEPVLLQYLHLMAQILSFEEPQALLEKRCGYIIPKLIKQISNVIGQPKAEFFIFHCSAMLLKMAASDETIRAALLKHRKEMDSWAKLK